MGHRKQRLEHLAGEDGRREWRLHHPTDIRGSHTFRVGASTPFGTVYSNQFTLVRAATNLVEEWRGEDIEVFPARRNVVAFTLGGGADNAGVGSILATLKANGVPATFLVTGDFARSFPSDVRAMAQARHPVGNHSDTHPYFTQISDTAIRQELSLANAAISPPVGRSTAPLFRFSYGDRTSADIEVVNDAGYVPIRWTVDTLGWKGTSEGSPRPSSVSGSWTQWVPVPIVLMHVGAHPRDGSTLDAHALQGMINDPRAHAYTFATVSSLLAE